MPWDENPVRAWVFRGQPPHMQPRAQAQQPKVRLSAVEALVLAAPNSPLRECCGQIGRPPETTGNQPPPFSGRCIQQGLHIAYPQHHSTTENTTASSTPLRCCPPQCQPRYEMSALVIILYLPQRLQISCEQTSLSTPTRKSSMVRPPLTPGSLARGGVMILSNNIRNSARALWTPPDSFGRTSAPRTSPSRPQFVLLPLSSYSFLSSLTD